MFQRLSDCSDGAEAPTPESLFAFMVELGATEIRGDSLCLLEQLVCQLGAGYRAGDGCRLLSSP